MDASAQPGPKGWSWLPPARRSALMVTLPCVALLTATPAAAQRPEMPFYQSLSWSPDGTRILFCGVLTSWDEGGGYRIYVMNADGSEQAQLSTGGDQEMYPVWSPDGTKIAYASRQNDNIDLFVMNADGSAVTRLTRDVARDSYPTWSPDGSRIAFQSNREGNYDIYVMNADGSKQRRLTRRTRDDLAPAWSPDGSRIVFEADRDSEQGDEVYLINPDGSGLTLLAESGIFPTWSPDGAQIIYGPGRRGEGVLRVINSDGSGEAVLAQGAFYAVWSPDGSRIAAIFNEPDRSTSIAVMNADGSGRKEIAH